MFNQYPYLNLNDLNLDYLLNEIKRMYNDVTNFVSINAIKYADPIQWNITSQYEKNTVVIDPLTGTAYISVAAVPSGVALTREEYWTVVFDLGSFVTRAAQNFTDHWESDTTTTATFATSTGGWLVWGDVLYKALTNITAGDTYVIGSNIEHFTIEDLYNAYLNKIAQILAMIGDLVDLNTTDKTNIVAAINEVITKVSDEATARQNADGEIIADVAQNTSDIGYNKHFLNVKEFGATGDGVSDDTTAIIATMNAANDYDAIYFPKGRYIIRQSLVIDKPLEIYGDGMGDVSTNTNGSGYGVTSLLFQNLNDCIVVRKANNYVRGVYIHDLCLKGSGASTNTIITAYNAVMCTFERLHIREYNYSGIYISSLDDLLAQFNHISDCDFVYGVHATTEGHSVTLIGQDDSHPYVTQNYIENIRTLSDNFAFVLQNTDNNVFTKCFAWAISGRSILLNKGANFNYFNYVTGSIEAQAQSYGNMVAHYVSEGGSVYIDSNATLYYDIQNYLTQEPFEHDSYWTTKSFFVSAGDLYTNSALMELNNNWNIPAIFPTTLGTTVNSQYLFFNRNMNSGKLTKARIYYYANAANASLSAKLLLYKYQLNQAPTAATVNIATTLADTEVRILRYVDIDTSAFTFDKDDLILVSFRLVDVNSLDIGLIGILFDYVTTEPSGVGMGNFVYTPLT